MARFILLAAAIATSVSLAALPASAQRIGGAPMPHLHAANPSLSLSARPRCSSRSSKTIAAIC
jgi:hypothetical protein